MTPIVFAALASLFAIPRVTVGAPAAAPAAPGPAAARVGPRAIPRAALDEAVQRRLNSGYFHSLSPEKTAAIRREELEKLVRRELEVLGGLDAGMKPPVGRAEAARAAIEKQLGKAEYDRSIALRGWVRADHARVLAEGMLAAEARKRFVTDRAAVADAEVRKEFEANRASYRMAEMRRVEEILLRVSPESGEGGWNKAEAEAAELLGRLRKGESFAALASARSADMYRIKGGDLGWVHRGRLVAPLEAAVWSARPETLIGPVRSDEGLHVARVTGARPARDMALEEAAPAIRVALQRKKTEAAEAAWYGELRRKYPVVVLEPALGAEAR